MVGKTASVSTTVSEKNTAKTVGSGSLNVFATPMMVALMEQAACECLNGLLEVGQTSVGTKISVEHNQASPIGEEVTATATIDAVENRRISFTVTAQNREHELGRGTHTRVIVDVERFMSRL